MNEDQLIKTIMDVYAAFGRGDVPAILSHVTDDVAWVSHLEPVVPWSGDFSGKLRVPRFFDAIFESVDVEAFEPKDWIARGHSLVSLGDFACKVRKTGKRSRTRWAFIWKFHDGKICSYEQFHQPGLADAFR